MSQHRSRLIAAGTLFCLGCNAIFGIEEGVLISEGGAPSSGGGGAGADGGGGSGSGGQPSCVEPMSVACFEAEPEKLNVGNCLGGTKTCEGGTFGECVGQVLPAPEDCYDRGDEDCDGAACSDLVWVKQLVSTKSAFGVVLGVLPDGGVVLTGTFEGEFNLGESPATLLSSSATAGFAAVLNKDGSLRWSRQFSLTSMWISVTPNGGLIASADFREPVTVGGTTFTPQGPSDIVIFGLDPMSGNPSNVTRIGGPGEDTGRIFMFPDGDFLLVGETDSTIDFGGAVGVLGPIIDDRGAFVVRASPNAVGKWGKVIEYANLYGFSPPFVWPKIEGDDVFLTTRFEYPLRGDVCPFFGGNTRNLALTRVSASGAELWSACTQGNVTQRGFAVDAAGGPTIMLNLDAATRLVPGTGPQLMVSPVGEPDLLIWKLTPNGNTAWAKKLGDEAYQGIDEGGLLGLDYNSANRLVVGSSLQGSVDFGEGLVVSSAGETDALLATLDEDGNALWAKSIGGPGPFQAFFSVNTDPSNDDIVGTVLSAAEIDFGDGQAYLPVSEAGIDSFIVKYQR